MTQFLKKISDMTRYHKKYRSKPFFAMKDEIGISEADFKWKETSVGKPISKSEL